MPTLRITTLALYARWSARFLKSKLNDFIEELKPLWHHLRMSAAATLSISGVDWLSKRCLPSEYTAVHLVDQLIGIAIVALFGIAVVYKIVRKTFHKPTGIHQESAILKDYKLATLGDPFFAIEEVLKPDELVKKILKSPDKLSSYVRVFMHPDITKRLKTMDDAGAKITRAQIVINEFNDIIIGQFEPKDFLDHIHQNDFSSNVKRILAEGAYSEEDARIVRNRMLFEYVYKAEFKTAQNDPALAREILNSSDAVIPKETSLLGQTPLTLMLTPPVIGSVADVQQVIGNPSDGTNN